MVMRRHYVQGMWGLGDNIYQRPFIRNLAQGAWVFLDTPWPELYEDLPNVRFVRGQRNLRTQLKNVARQHPGRWVGVPVGSAPLRVRYDMARQSLVDDMAACFNTRDRVSLDLPVFPAWPKEGKPIALVRPVTVRTEWLNAARNPLPQYVTHAAEQLMATHHVIAVADLADKQETAVGGLPPHHTGYLRGELTVDRLLALVQAADVLVGGVGWIVPAAVAANKPAFIILGGQGGHNGPDKILAPWWSHQLTFAKPTSFCQCSSMKHDCHKEIPNLPALFSQFIQRAACAGSPTQGMGSIR